MVTIGITNSTVSWRSSTGLFYAVVPIPALNAPSEGGGIAAD